MARTKTDSSIWVVFFDAMKIFCMNIHKFFLYMAFPVLGQIIGIFLMYGLAFWFSGNLNAIIEKYPVMNNFSSIITAITVLVLPGLLIFIKAFWDYLVAYVALNSMTEGALTTGRVYDFPAHNAIVKNKKFSFIVLWLLFGIFCMFASFPLLWVLGGILFIYFVLIFQILTFEEVSAFECFKRSLTVIKGHFARTALLMGVLGVVVYLFYHGVTVLFELGGINRFFLGVFENWAMTLPLDQINSLYHIFGVLITPKMIAQCSLTTVTLFLVFGFLLPLRSITWTLWYKNLNIENPQEQSKKVRNKSRKKLDPNVLNRAMREDEDF